MIAIKIVSPYPLHSFGLTKFFDTVPGLHAVSPVNEMLAKGVSYDLAVVVADGRQASLDLVRQETRTNPVLVMGSSAEPAVIQEYLGSGVFGYVHLSVPLRTLVSAVFAVAARGHFISVEEVSEPMAKPEPPADSSGLTARENEVLAHIAAGHTHGQVARMLGISRHTVDTYVKRVRKKLGVGNKADLTRAAMELCLAAPAPAVSVFHP
jgi:two-component system invasion response regulator UvrY